MTKELLRYHRQVRKKLDCPKPMRDQFLADARCMTDNFLAENPGATMDELQSTVGEPDQLATMFLDSADSDIVEGYRKKKDKTKRLAVILLAAAFVAVSAFTIWAASVPQDPVLTKKTTIIVYETDDGIEYETYEENYDIVP